MLFARLFVSGAGLGNNKSAKIKRNNVNHYACRRINALARICTAAETKY